MKSKNKTPETVAEYIALHPPKVQKKLKKIRSIIRKNAPDALEKISYGMPGYIYLGMLIYFAAYKNHIGLYAMPSAIIHFQKKLTGYRLSKGTIQLPIDAAVPELLLAQIVKFRVKENVAKKKLKTNQPNLFR